MAVKLVVEGGVQHFLGPSSDRKPLESEGAEDGARFTEIDTSRTYLFADGAWFAQDGGAGESVVLLRAILAAQIKQLETLEELKTIWAGITA